jgi:hypothetical protein
MPKHYKEMMDEIINKIEEDAPANAVGTGANVALPPAVEPGVNKKRQRDPLMFAKPMNKTFCLRKTSKISKLVEESDDNNNVVLRNIIDRIENIETKLDEKIYGKTEFEVKEVKEYKTFRDKYNAKKI